MTRLKTEWIDYMLDGMTDYNNSLKTKTGFDLLQKTHRQQGDKSRRFITLCFLKQGQLVIYVTQKRLRLVLAQRF